MDDDAGNGSADVHDISTGVSLVPCQPGLDLQSYGSSPVREHDLDPLSILTVGLEMAGKTSLGRRSDDIAVLCNVEDQLGPVPEYVGVDLHSVESTAA